MKRYANSAIVYAILAMVGGVFYREFTKILGFVGKTNLSVLHTHYFVFGMIFFLLLLLLEKNFSFANQKTNKIICTYHIGLNITCIAFIVRGTLQALEKPLTSAVDASISGVAGIGHIILGVCIVLLLLQIKRAVVASSALTHE